MVHRSSPSRNTSQAPEASFAVGSGEAADYQRGVKAALAVISEIRLQYTPAAQGRTRFSIHDMSRAFKGALDLAREDIAKLLDEAGSAPPPSEPRA
jgi:hypothetical protein